jgi:hypothetical protein
VITIFSSAVLFSGGSVLRQKKLTRQKHAMTSSSPAAMQICALFFISDGLFSNG